LTRIDSEAGFKDDFVTESLHALNQSFRRFTDEQCRAAMKKVARALRPKGVCVMLDLIRLKEPGKGGQTAAILDFYFAMVSESGTWPIETMQEWLRSTDLKPLKPIRLRTMPGGALVGGDKFADGGRQTSTGVAEYLRIIATTRSLTRALRCSHCFPSKCLLPQRVMRRRRALSGWI
jgi:hypothetical protein